MGRLGRAPRASVRSGLTLLELIVSMTIVVIVTAAVSRAFPMGLYYEKNLEQGRADIAKRVRFEDRMRAIIQRAILSANQADPVSFFQGSVLGTQSIGGNADTLIFTSRGLPVPGVLLSSTDDFETLNQKYGPYGGTAEIQISSTPVGDDGQNKQGLFIRQQIPADGDPTQGGQESVLSADIQSIGFEFWDGLTWQQLWDTQTMTPPKRLPAAVRVTYTLTGEDSSAPQHTFIVRLPLSDVTAENPVAQTGSTGTP